MVGYCFLKLKAISLFAYSLISIPSLYEIVNRRRVDSEYGNISYSIPGATFIDRS